MIPISDYLPDQPTYNGAAGEALNVVPRARSYGPIAGLQSYTTNSLGNPCQGAASFRGSNNIIGHYAGDQRKLYMLSNTNGWIDASGGMAFSSSDDGRWNFCQFGSLALAVNGVDQPQKITIGAGATFGPLGGTPPKSKYVTVVRDFVFMGNLSTDPQAVQWSAINNAESWAIGTNQADIQSIPDGGWVQGLVGGEFGLVFSELAINRFTYIGGSLIFQRDQLVNGIGASVAGSVAGFSDRAFCLHRTGFYMVLGGSQLVPIGAERVNNYIWERMNQNFLHRVSAAIDPENNVYVLSFPNSDAPDGVPNEWLIYNWVTNKWSHALPGAHEFLYPVLSSRQWTLEEIGAVYTDLDNVPYSLDSAYWTGIGRLLMGAFSQAHKGMIANGPSLPATVDSAEFQPIDGQRAFIRSVRPLIDASGAALSVAAGYRNQLNDAILWSPYVPLSPSGRANLRQNGRYHRIRLRTQAGDQWTHILGVDELTFSKAGSR